MTATTRLAAAVSVGMFCVQFDAFALNSALPRLGRALGAPAGGLHWVVSAYLLSAGTLMLGAGRLGDLYGRRRLFVAGLALFGAASVVCAVAPALPVLVAGRMLQGAGGALFMTSGLALLTVSFPPELRGRAIGGALGVAGVATAFGPYAGGVLAQTVSWRAIFWANVPLTLLAGLLARTRPAAYEAAPPLDRTGLVTGTAALAVLALGIDRRSVAAIAVAALLLAAFVRTERRTPYPLIDLALFRNTTYVALTAAGAVANAATVVFLFVVPRALQGEWGLAPAAAGAAFLLPAALMAVAGPVAGRVGRFRAVPVMAGALGAASVTLGAAALARTPAAYLAAVTACGAALGLANALTLVATQAVVRPERAGEASGVTKSVITVAGGLGVVLAGGGGPATALAVSGAGCLLAALGLWKGPVPVRHGAPGAGGE